LSECCHEIAVNNELHLSEFRFQDKDALIAHLNDRDITTGPFASIPYTENDADEWLAWLPRSPSSKAVRFTGPFAAPPAP